MLKAAANPKLGTVNGRENFIQYGTILFADSEPRHTVISAALALALFSREQVNQYKLRATRNSVTVREDFALISPLFCSHRVFLVFHFLGFVCRSMPMLEKLSMPLAVRLAGITNCHVFVHALRTIK